MRGPGDRSQCAGCVFHCKGGNLPKVSAAWMRCWAAAELAVLVDLI